MYNTKSMTDKNRIPELHRNADFNICEHCEVEYEENKGYSIKYAHQYGLILCDRCLDKSNDDWYWQDKDAAKSGFPNFPYPAPTINDENMKELKIYQRNEFKKRKVDKIDWLD